MLLLYPSGITLYIATMKQALWAIIFTSVVLGACSNGRIEGSFTAEELEWLVYDKGENIMFVNKTDSSDILQYTVIDRTDSEQIKQYYPIQAEVTMRNEATGDEMKIFLLKDQKAFKRYFKIGDVYRSFDLMYPQDQVPILDKTYDGVYVFSEDENNRTGSIAQVFFNKAYGVLQYITDDEKEYVQLVERPVNFESGHIN